MSVRILTRLSVDRLRLRARASSNGKYLCFSTNPEQIHCEDSVPVSNLLQSFDLSKPQLDELLAKTRFLSNGHMLETEKSLGLLQSFNLPRESLVSIVCSCPGVLDYDFMKKWEMGFSHFGVCGVSSSMVQSVLECSKRFEIGPDEFVMCLRVFKGFGLSDGAVVKVFEKFPRVVLIDEQELGRRFGFLAEMGLRRNEVDKVCSVCPEVLGFGVEDRLKPLMDEFAKLGFETCNVKEEIVKDPRMLCLELGELSRCLTWLRTLKCRHLTKCRIFKKGDIRAGFEAKLRIDCLCRHGLTLRDAFRILKEEPRIILYPLEDMEKKISFLKEKLKYDISCLVEVPHYLGINYDKQIIPRYNVIEHLRSKGGLGCEVGLRGFAKLSRLNFYNVYVKPYPDCEEIYGRFADFVEKKGHPVGLWKIMKPYKSTESKEDVQSMKAFMKSSPSCSK
ncbi:hypothetical protein QQ045_011462 [Rhodiola kirilowii]